MYQGHLQRQMSLRCCRLAALCHRHQHGRLPYHRPHEKWWILPFPSTLLLLGHLHSTPTLTPPLDFSF
ncbi:hypothetical protein GN956_G16392 [Arapaima gigas]